MIINKRIMNLLIHRFYGFWPFHKKKYIDLLLEHRSDSELFYELQSETYVIPKQNVAYYRPEPVLRSLTGFSLY